MSSLLQQDFNAINYDSCYYKRIEIDLPKGNLGVELEKEQYFKVVEIYSNSKAKDLLKIGDEIFSFNEIPLDDKNVDEVEMLFYKSILAERKIVIYR